MIPAPEVLEKLAGCPVHEIKRLAGDGSARVYYRLRLEKGGAILCHGPSKEENAAFVRIARHLEGAGVRVPGIFAADLAKGLILMEDLGDVNLLSLLKTGADPLEIYRPVLHLLVKTQVDGAKGFTLETGFADASYGPELMVRAEGLYFVDEFASGVLGLKIDRDRIEGELKDLAARAIHLAGETNRLFLHRDFQSRNIQITPEGPALIDFQGARPGPPAYDAAALILDPYAALPGPVRYNLFETYIVMLGVAGVDPLPVRQSWPLIASYRLMQALGAFGKLGKRLGKPGFLEHSGKALTVLLELTGHPSFERAPALKTIVSTCLDEWNARGRLTGGGQ